MFGVWRTMLALSVVAYHLLYFPVIGKYAVFSFFVLSGFLTTTVMQGSTADCVAAALGLFVIHCSAWGSRGATCPNVSIPVRLDSMLDNATMIFPALFRRATAPRSSPPTWALTIEIACYVAIGLEISKAPPRGFGWPLACSLSSRRSRCICLTDITTTPSPRGGEISV